MAVTTEPEEYVARDLFGGAITADLPTTFADVSDIRQVHDHQEVWLDRDGFTSVAIDILERVQEAVDAKALQYHLKDIVDEDAGETKIWSTNSSVHFPKLPAGVPACSLFATSPPGEKQRGRENEPEFVGILLTLVRLVEQETDVLVAVNVPHIVGQYGVEEVRLEEGVRGGLVERAERVMERVIGSFEIREWELFVN